MRTTIITSAISRQRGMTMIGVIMLLIIIAFGALIAMRIAPIYIEYFSIRQAIESLKSEGVAGMNKFDIQRSLEKHFDISYVSVIKAKDLKVIKKGGDLILELAYEDRRPLLANLDVVAVFNDDIVLTK